MPVGANEKRIQIPFSAHLGTCRIDFQGQQTEVVELDMFRVETRKGSTRLRREKLVQVGQEENKQQNTSPLRRDLKRFYVGPAISLRAIQQGSTMSSTPISLMSVRNWQGIWAPVKSNGIIII